MVVPVLTMCSSGATFGRPEGTRGMIDVSEALSHLSAGLSRINPRSVVPDDRSRPKHCTTPEWLLSGVTVSVYRIVDWLEINRSPAHAYAFQKRFQHLEQLAGKVDFNGRTKRERTAMAFFLLEKFRFREYLRDLADKIAETTGGETGASGPVKDHRRIRLSTRNGLQSGKVRVRRSGFTIP